MVRRARHGWAAWAVQKRQGEKVDWIDDVCFHLRRQLESAKSTPGFYGDVGVMVEFRDGKPRINECSVKRRIVDA